MSDRIACPFWACSGHADWTYSISTASSQTRIGTRTGRLTLSVLRLRQRVLRTSHRRAAQRSLGSYARVMSRLRASDGRWRYESFADRRLTPSIWQAWVTMILVLFAGFAAACSSTEDVRSPDGSFIAVLETSSSPPNTSWAVSVELPAGREKRVVACFDDDAGVNYSPVLRWRSQTTLLIETTIGPLEVTIASDGRTLSVKDPDKISLC